MKKGNWIIIILAVIFLIFLYVFLSPQVPKLDEVETFTIHLIQGQSVGGGSGEVTCKEELNKRVSNIGLSKCWISQFNVVVREEMETDIYCYCEYNRLR